MAAKLLKGSEGQKWQAGHEFFLENGGKIKNTIYMRR